MYRPQLLSKYASVCISYSSTCIGCCSSVTINHNFICTSHSSLQFPGYSSPPSISPRLPTSIPHQLQPPASVPVSHISHSSLEFPTKHLKCMHRSQLPRVRPLSRDGGRPLSSYGNLGGYPVWPGELSEATLWYEGRLAELEGRGEGMH